MVTANTSLFARKNVIIMGLGHFGGGLGAAQWFVAQNAHVTVTDAAKAENLAEPLALLKNLPITFKLGGHDPADLVHADLLVINPAVDRAKSAFVQAALQAGVPCTTEMNLFLERCRARTIGITGSVGKSTTTALIYEALKAALGGTRDANHETRNVFLGGNIGRSLLLELPAIGPRDFVVLELSSFMLEETPAIAWSPEIAVVTNIFPNHLDRHGNIEAYMAAKQNILRFQKPTDRTLLNADHDIVSRWTNLARGKVATFTAHDAHLELAMPGEHNQSNAAAALAVMDALAGTVPLNRDAACSVIAHFPGLAHRLQCVHTIEKPHRIGFYNDSKATSPDATVTALRAFAPRTAIFIIGGYDKHLPREAWATFEQLLVERAVGVIGIGQTSKMLLAQLQERCAAADVTLPLHDAATLEHAVPLAGQWAMEKGASAVVLSPASASWGQFTHFEKRGEKFAELSRQCFPA